MSLNKDDNRVVIITGLSQGIGQSILKDFVESGTNVLANSPNEQELKKIVSSISDLNDYDNNNRISYLVGDITEKGFAEVLVEEAIKKWGRIDILINNAKITNNPKIKCDDEVISENKQQQREQPSSYFVPEEYETSDPMIRGIYYCIKAAVTRMLSNNDGNATIINISSCQGCLSQ